jgi:hypothetical protein
LGIQTIIPTISHKLQFPNVKIDLFQSNTAEVENGDASFNPADETVEVKTKPDKPSTKRVQQPKMVKIGHQLTQKF